MIARIARPVALYARVSTDDKDQDPELQLVPMREYAADRGWEVVEFVDKASANDMRGRTQWRSLLEDADRRKVGLVMVWKIDRAFRSNFEAHTTLKRLDDAGVAFRSHTQDFIDTTTPEGRLVFAFFSATAEWEGALIRDRVKEGMRNAARKGIRIGRPSVLDDPAFVRKWDAARAEIEAGTLSQRQAAKRLKVGQATIKRLRDAA